MTNENLNELIAALPPADDAEILPPDDHLRAILADLAHRPAPINSLHRLWTLGELSTQVALAYSVLWVRKWFAGEEGRKRLTMETNLRIALRLFHRLAYLRGAMTKLGQTAGQLPNLVSKEIADTLDRLHFEAPSMHYSLVREVFVNEFGKEPEEMFAGFEHDAFAAASLGQVHRARLRTGEEVAVKIQYPGIARTIDADFRNLGALLFPLRLSDDWDYVKAQFEAVRHMLNQEVDYRQEAASLRRARALFNPEEGCLVPRVFDEYSGERVLTSEFIRGRHLNDFLATNPSQAVRDRFGALIYQSHFRLYYAGMNYGDPHPGNYLFRDDGTLGLIDFGCVQYYRAEERHILELCERLIAGDESARPPLWEVAAGVAKYDASNEAYRALLQKSEDWMMEPMRCEGKFDFGDEAHLERGFEWFSAMVAQRTMRGHPMYVYFNRCVFGVKSLLYRLRARVDVKALHTVESAKMLPYKEQ